MIATALIAVFFAPSLIPAGHGVGAGPALVSARKDEYLRVVPIEIRGAPNAIRATQVVDAPVSPKP